MYISLATWRDLSDGHLYHEGEEFPFDGREIASTRLTELESGRNRAGLRLIRAIDVGVEQAEGQKADEPREASEGQTEASAEETPKAKTRRSRTKK